MARIINLKFLICFISILLFRCFCVFSAVNAAGIPKILNHQGRLFDTAGELLGGESGTDYCFKFSMYDDAMPGAPDNKFWPMTNPSIMTVSVKDGVFNAGVGDVSAGGDALDFNFQDKDEIYLNVEVASKVGVTCSPTDGAEVFENLSPRQRIYASGYSINSDAVDGFHASQTAVGNQVPVLNSGNLILGSSSAQINSTSTNSLRIQGNAVSGNTLLNAISGFVGIGTASPEAKLHIVGNGGVLNLEGTDHAYIQFYPDGYAAGRKAYFGFPNSESNDITIYNEINGGNIVLDGAGGNVGIGTSAPSSKLEVVGGYATSSLNSGGFGLHFASGGDTPDHSQIWWGDNTGWRLNFGTKGIDNTFVPRVTFMDTGEVGIGMNAPKNLFDVKGSIAVGDYAGIYEAPENSLIISGKLGLGSSNPQAKLHIFNVNDEEGNLMPLKITSDGNIFAKFENSEGVEKFSFDSQGIALASGFLNKQMNFSEEFVRVFANITSDKAGGGTTGMGDSFAWGAGELGACVWSSLGDVIGGILRQSTSVAASACLTYLSAGSSNAQLILNAENNPIIILKVKPSVVGSGNWIFAGMMNFSDGSLSDPPNGIYFSNEGGDVWTGVVKSGASKTVVSCSGQNVLTNQFALLRISASSTGVEFFVDNNASDGINETSCGFIQTGLPTVNLTAEIINQVRAGGMTSMNIDTDFVRISQDDVAIKGKGYSASTSSPETGDDDNKDDNANEDNNNKNNEDNKNDDDDDILKIDFKQAFLKIASEAVEFVLKVKKIIAETVETASLKTEKAQIGSEEKPTGILFFDVVTKKPYCVGVENGELSKKEGDCENTDIGAPQAPENEEKNKDDKIKDDENLKPEDAPPPLNEEKNDEPADNSKNIIEETGGAEEKIEPENGNETTEDEMVKEKEKKSEEENKQNEETKKEESENYDNENKQN
ncbi:MAG: hypothetical protein WC430_00660 [Patescibacteria group bacterium]